MARKLRVEYPGAIYHRMNCGDRREPIFKDETDRLSFGKTLGEACAYVLLPNPFRLLVETPESNLVAGMK